MKKLILPVTLLLAMVAGAVAFYLFNQINNTVDTTIPSETPTPTPPEAEEVRPQFETQTQTIQDSAGLYSLELPDDWQVTLEDARGVRLSGLMAQSPDYLSDIDTEVEGPTAMVYYIAGASLQVTVTSEPLSANPYPAGLISENTPIQVDGVNGAMYAFQEPSTAEGSLLEVRLEKDGRSYFFRWSYNDETFPQGRLLFAAIMQSVQFL